MIFRAPDPAAAIVFSTRRTDQIVTDPGQLIWGIDHDLYEVEGHPYMLVQW